MSCSRTKHSDACEVVVDDLMIIVAPIVCGSSVFGPCFVVQYFVSVLSFAIILMGKRELIALL